MSGSGSGANGGFGPQPAASWRRRPTYPGSLVLVIVAVLGATGLLEDAMKSRPLAGVQDGVIAYLDSSESSPWRAPSTPPFPS